MLKTTFSKKLKTLAAAGAILILSGNLLAESAFSGETGGNIRFASGNAADKFEPELTLNTYFSGQTLITPNIWFRTGFSVETENLCTPSALSKTPGTFDLDEISLTMHQNISKANNYLTLFLGNTDDFGTDILFQRLFNADSISSKLNQPAFGYKYNDLFDQSGLGISDIIRFEKPSALGLYAYVNMPSSGVFQFSGDLRFIGSSRLISWDVKGGVNYVNNTLDWHAGTSILLGNSQIQSLFLQAAVAKGSITGEYFTSLNVIKDLYVLVEPRFVFGPVKLHISAYAKDSMGANLNFFYDSMGTKSNGITAGLNAGMNIPSLTILTIKDAAEKIITKNYTINASPYFEGEVLEGKLRISADIDVTKILAKDYLHCAALNAGWKTTF